MKFNVPQFIEIEDKIAFQLTAKQLGWFALGGVLAFFAYSIFDRASFIAWSIVLAILSVILAFYRPAGISVVSFLKYGFIHLVKPKVYVWRVEYKKSRDASVAKKGNKKNKTKKKDEKGDIDDLDEIIEMMDSQRL